jgi:uncharacterized protein YgbK (DUF1537 family)
MMRVLLVADDLTGAADSAAPFVRQGYSTYLIFQSGVIPDDSEVIAFSTETRSLSSLDARVRLHWLLPSLHLDRAEWLFCKVDSQLRGHPGVELGALMEAGGVALALAAPAFPAQGRITRGGIQLVHEIPLSETPTGRKVGTSSVAQVMRRDRELQIVEVSLAEVRARGIDLALQGIEDRPTCFIADAETEDDLDELVRRADRAGVRLLCGSAGLAGALARKLSGTGESRLSRSPREAGLSGEGILAVSASYHPSTRSQVEFLRQKGFTVLEIPLDVALGKKASGEILQRIYQAREQNKVCLVLTLPLMPRIVGEENRLAQGLAKLVCAACQQKAPAGMVLTGGDAAAAVCRELGVEALRLGGEVQPGIPWGILEGGMLPGSRVVTKSGGFGDETALWSCCQFLEKMQSHSSSVTP